jgi:hypothetical protein
LGLFQGLKLTAAIAANAACDWSTESLSGSKKMLPDISYDIFVKH